MACVEKAMISLFCLRLQENSQYTSLVTSMFFYSFVDVGVPYRYQVVLASTDGY
jgi:hypothetical protein